MLGQVHTHTIAAGARPQRRTAQTPPPVPAPGPEDRHDRAARTPAAHPLPALTSSELTRYRRELEHAIATLNPAAPVQDGLHSKLARSWPSRPPALPPAAARIPDPPSVPRSPRARCPAPAQDRAPAPARTPEDLY